MNGIKLYSKLVTFLQMKLFHRKSKELLTNLRIYQWFFNQNDLQSKANYVNKRPISNFDSKVPQYLRFTGPRRTSLSDSLSIHSSQKLAKSFSGFYHFIWTHTYLLRYVSLRKLRYVLYSFCVVLTSKFITTVWFNLNFELQV